MEKNMRRSSKIILILLAVSLLFGTLSCGKRNKDNSDKIIEDLLFGEDSVLHEKRLPECETPYTLCYQNNDGSVSVYIFPSPIAYKDENGCLKLIDTALKPVKEKALKRGGYVLRTSASDVISYYPNKLSANPIIVKSQQAQISFNIEESYRGNRCVQSVYSDLLGREHDTVSYLDNNSVEFEYLPTATGTTIYITFNEKPKSNEISFFIDKLPNTSFTLLDNKLITITPNTNSTPVGVVRQSFLADAKGKTSFNSNVRLEESSSEAKCTFILDDGFISDTNTNYPVSFSVSFDIMPNSLTNVSNYTNQPNDILSDYSVLGVNDYHGNGSLYLKFRVAYFIKSYEQNVKQANYNFVNLIGGLGTPIAFQRIKGFWNTNSLNNELPEAYATEGNVNIDDSGRCSIDITEYIKLCVYDDSLNTEDYGLLVCNNGENMKIISNYNNSIYKPYVRIDFYDLPWTFENVEKIDPST